MYMPSSYVQIIGDCSETVLTCTCGSNFTKIIDANVTKLCPGLTPAGPSVSAALQSRDAGDLGPWVSIGVFSDLKQIHGVQDFEHY